LCSLSIRHNDNEQITDLERRLRIGQFDCLIAFRQIQPAQVHKQIAVARFSAAGKPLPAQALALLAIQ
jgi:hypothetical protein